VSAQRSAGSRDAETGLISYCSGLNTTCHVACAPDHTLRQTSHQSFLRRASPPPLEMLNKGTQGRFCCWHGKNYPAKILHWAPRESFSFGIRNTHSLKVGPSRKFPWSIIRNPHWKCHKCDIFCDICDNSRISTCRLKKILTCDICDSVGQIPGLSVNVPHGTWFRGPTLYPWGLSNCDPRSRWFRFRGVHIHSDNGFRLKNVQKTPKTNIAKGARFEFWYRALRGCVRGQDVVGS